LGQLAVASCGGRGPVVEEGEWKGKKKEVDETRSLWLADDPKTAIHRSTADSNQSAHIQSYTSQARFSTFRKRITSGHDPHFETLTLW
jgi:hypothetical protein